MPYQSPWQQGGNEFGQMGDAFSSAIVRMAQARMQAQHMQMQEQSRMQEMELKRQELEAQKALYGSHMKLYDSQAAETSAKTMRENAILSAAKAFGGQGGEQSSTNSVVPGTSGLAADDNESIMGSGFQSAPASQSPGQNDQAAALRVVMALLAHPERAAEYDTKNQANQFPMNQDLANAVRTGTKSMIPVGHEGSVFNVGSGDMATSPQTLGIGQVLEAIARSGQGATQIAKGPEKPVQTDSDQKTLGSLGNIIRGVSESGMPPMKSSAVYPTYTNSLNLVNQTIDRMQKKQSEQPQIAPPHQRQVGDKVTTAKGTFQWNGQGWDPVNQ